MSRKGNETGDDAVSSMVDYIIITGVMVTLMVVMLIVTNAVFLEGPANTVKYHSYVDIGNGVSVRIVDLYVIAPVNGIIYTKIDLPDDVIGEDYSVKMDPFSEGAAQRIIITDGQVERVIAIGGIGATKGVIGNTTGSGLNVISYESGGV